LSLVHQWTPSYADTISVRYFACQLSHAAPRTPLTRGGAGCTRCAHHSQDLCATTDAPCGSRLYLRATIHIDVHGSTVLVLPRLGLVLSDVSVVLRVRLARSVEHCMCIAACRAPWAVFFRAITLAVTLGTDRASDLASARCPLVSVPVTVVAWTAVDLTMEGE
jgi:hypothetical protein